MNVHTTHRGANRPFERDRHLVLRALPVGATITSATATARPISTDVGGRFLEAVEFDGSDGTWGAHQRTAEGWVEVDLRARRRLSTVSGANIDGGVLLVDLGGGFTAVDANGGLGDDSEFPIEADVDQELPGLVVAGLRIKVPTGANGSTSSVDRLQVASPPSNVTLAVEGGPTFWTHFGELVDEMISPDFSELLQEAMAGADIVHGHHVIGLVVHSDSIARLDLTLDIDYVTTLSATPDGVDRISVPYGFGSTPSADAAAGALTLTVPRGSVAAPGSTAGRVQGAFAPTRIVHGPVGRVHIDGQATVDATTSHAQPFRLAATEVVTSVDVLVAAVTSSAELTVDVVGDLDGKPDQVSLLPAIAARVVSRDEAPDATWINIGLPAEFEFQGGTRYWLVIQARQGTLTWSQAPAAVGAAPSLQTTTNGGLSWRTPATGAAEAHLRLRHTTPTFHMPLELRISTGGEETVVDLDRFEASGNIDFSLDFPEVADAVNRSLDAAGAASQPTAEHIENGGFDRWYRLGDGVAGDRPVATVDGPGAGAFSPDGSTVLVAGPDRFEAHNTFCRTPMYSTAVDLGLPFDMIVDPTGTVALVASIEFDDVIDFSAVSMAAAARFRGFAGFTSLVDVATGRRIGGRVEVEGVVGLLQRTADGTGVYAALAASSGPVAIVVIPWADLRAAHRSSVTLRDLAPERVLVPGNTRAYTVAADGDVYVIVNEDDTVEVRGFESRLGSNSTTLSRSYPLDNAIAVAPLINRPGLVVLGTFQVLVIDLPSGRPIARHDLLDGSEGVSLVADPHDGSVLVATDDGVHRLSPTGRSLEGPVISSGPATSFLMGPATNRLLERTVLDNSSTRMSLLRVGVDLPVEWELTAGEIRPGCAGHPPQPVAALGGVGKLAVESALSQVVPVVADTGYRFSFEAAAFAADTTAQILWRTEDCGAARIDTVPIDPVRGGSELGSSLDRTPRLRRYDRSLVSPPGAVAAEVRFHTFDGPLVLDAVSLGGITTATTNAALTASDGGLDGWDSAGVPPAVAAGDSGAATLTAVDGDGAIAQTVAVTGSRYRLDAVARTLFDSVDTEIITTFLDGGGLAVGESVRIPVTALTFDRLVAEGEVPVGAVDAQLALLLPASATVEVEELALSFIDPVSVSLEFVSEAPGDLTVSDVSVGIDDAAPTRPPVPDGGLCPATPPGSDPGEHCDSCYCPCCGSRPKVAARAPALTPSGRPGTVLTCATCEAPIIVAGGRSSMASGGGNRLTWGRRTYRVAVHPTNAVPVREPVVIVRAPITDIRGIGPARARDLAVRGVTNIVDLAGAEPATVASVNGISLRQAADYVAQAGRIVQDQGISIL